MKKLQPVVEHLRGDQAADLAAGDVTQVFYVEHQAVDVLIMEALCRRRPGLRLIVATSGRNAIDIAPGLRPALLLLDLRLPDCRGAQLLAPLRSVPGWAAVPAIAVTAEAAFDAAGTGFLEVWRKPLDADGVLVRLDQLLARSRPPCPGERVAPLRRREPCT